MYKNLCCASNDSCSYANTCWYLILHSTKTKVMPRRLAKQKPCSAYKAILPLSIIIHTRFDMLLCLVWPFFHSLCYNGLVRLQLEDYSNKASWVLLLATSSRIGWVIWQTGLGLVDWHLLFLKISSHGDSLTCMAVWTPCWSELRGNNLPCIDTQRNWNKKK